MKKLREIVEATKSLHPMALHVKPVMVNGQQKYHVHAVGKDLADGIKHGEHLSDSELDDAHEMGAKVKHVKESVNEGKMAELDHDLKNMKDKDFETHYGEPKSAYKPSKKDKPEDKSSKVEEAMSHQAKTTMKHIPNASPALKKAAKDIKPGIAGIRDRFDMLRAGGVKEEVEVVYEANIQPTAAKSRSHIGNLSHPTTNHVAHPSSGKEIGVITKQPDGKYHAHPSSVKLSHSQGGTFDTKDQAHQHIRDAHAKAIKTGTLSDRWKKQEKLPQFAKEDVEQIDELSLQTMKSAKEKLANKAYDAHMDDHKMGARNFALRALKIGSKIKSKERSASQMNKEETDFGPEADKNITVQLKKAMDMIEHGEKTGSDVEFADGQQHFVEGVIAHKVLVAMEQMKPEIRAQAQNAVYQSFAHLMAAHQMLSK